MQDWVADYNRKGDDGGKKCRRQRSGNDVCKGRRRQRQKTAAMTDNNTGGQLRQWMTMACKIGRQTIGKDKSRQRETAETAALPPDCLTSSFTCSFCVVARPPLSLCCLLPASACLALSSIPLHLSSNTCSPTQIIA
jgi:hypothetical protein